ncbi:hypothetical protein FHG87_008638 [Trinorchestia longiramus]|nr:hypothetical protein FHG87_008638 [Trinorchestia longiramus]
MSETKGVKLATDSFENFDEFWFSYNIRLPPTGFFFSLACTFIIPPTLKMRSFGSPHCWGSSWPAKLTNGSAEETAENRMATSPSTASMGRTPPTTFGVKEASVTAADGSAAQPSRSPPGFKFGWPIKRS